MKNLALVIFGYALLAFAFFGANPIDSVFANRDSLELALPLRQHFAEMGLRNWHWWLEQQFLGLPQLGTLETGMLYPPNILLWLPLSFYTLHNLWMLGHQLAAALGCFFYLRRLQLSRSVAFMGGAFFATCGAFTAHKTHLAIFSTAAWIPWFFLCLDGVLLSANRKWVGALGLVIGCQICAGSPQIFLYAQLCGVIYILSCLISTRRIPWSRIVFAWALGCAMALPQLLAASELAALSWRNSASYQYFGEYNLVPLMVPVMIAPYLFGGYQMRFWGQWNLTEVGCYVGLLPLVLALVALRRTCRWQERAFQISAAWSFILALGPSLPTYRFFFELPLYNKFRCPGRHLIDWDFAILILGCLALSRILERQEGYRQILKRAVYALCFIGMSVLLSVFWAKQLLGSSLAPELLTDTGRQIISANFSRHNLAILTPLVFVLMNLGVVGALWVWPTRHRLLVTVSTLVILADINSFSFFFDNRWPTRLEAQSRFSLYTKLAQKAPGRWVVDSEHSSLNVPKAISKLNSVQPLNPGLLFDSLAAKPRDFSQRVTDWEVLVRTNTLLSVLGVRYLVVREPESKELLTVANLERPGVVLLSNQTQSLVGNPFEIVPGATYETSLPAGIYRLDILQDALSANKKKQCFISSFREKQVYVELDNSSSISTVFSAPSKGTLKIRNRFTKTLTVQSISLAPFQESREVSYIPVQASEGESFYENRFCMPPVYCVERLEFFDSFEEIKERLYSGTHQPNSAALMLRVQGVALPEQLSPGRCEVISKTTDHFQLKATSKSGTFLVVSDQFYPGWEAFLDGTPIKIHAPYGLLRGIHVPAGEHAVRFHYRPGYARLIPLAGLACALAMALLLLSSEKRGSHLQS